MTRDAWSPATYERFKAERAQPFHDLASLVQPRPDMVVADLGCGTGELTALLHRELGAASTLGVDNSARMLAESDAHAGPGLRYRLGDVSDFPQEGERGRFDLVFSNAALHWLPDHEALLGAITTALRPGGQLAVQVPANFDHPSHTVAVEVAAEEPFASLLGGWSHPVNVLPPEAYSRRLHELGFARQGVRLQVYLHVLENTGAVVDWVSGTLLTAYSPRLGSHFEEFVARYRERLLDVLGDTAPFPFTFKRILFWAELPDLA